MSKGADSNWIKVSPDSGVKGTATITVEVESNNGEVREGSLIIRASTIERAIIVTQKAKEPEPIETKPEPEEKEDKDGEASNDLAIDLFFSEYVEGSSNNKYLEIYNGTGATIDLSDYKIELYVNGQTKVKTTEILKGLLLNGEVVVYKHSKAAIYEGEATASTAINFNGNDAIALVKISTDDYVDIFGRIGDDPGKAWKAPLDPEVSSLDKTLVRKPSVHSGVTVNPKKDFPTLSSEWIAYPIDTADYLGSHTMD